MVSYKKDGAPTPVKPGDNKKNAVVVDNIDKSATLYIVVVGINDYKK